VCLSAGFGISRTPNISIIISAVKQWYHHQLLIITTLLSCNNCSIITCNVIIFFFTTTTMFRCHRGRLTSKLLIREPKLHKLRLGNILYIPSGAFCWFNQTCIWILLKIVVDPFPRRFCAYALGALKLAVVRKIPNALEFLLPSNVFNVIAVVKRMTLCFLWKMSWLQTSSSHLSHNESNHRVCPKNC